MHSRFVYVELLLALAIGLTQGSQFSRDESSEDTKTEFALASTLNGGISTNRHHARAHLNSQLYPDVTQPPIQQPSAGYGSADIDEPSAHENGGSGIGTLNIPVAPAGNRVLPPGNRVAGPQHQIAVPPIYPKLPVGGPVGYPAQQAPLPGYPYGGFNIPSNSPEFGYPGRYLPQYPTYPQAGPLPVYPGYPGLQPGLPGNVPPLSYQNQQHFMPRQREHFDRSFTMNTEYKEDGVHRGPFDVLNNHNRPGYGSGFGGGYNGAFNRPGY